MSGRSDGAVLGLQTVSLLNEPRAFLPGVPLFMFTFTSYVARPTHPSLISTNLSFFLPFFSMEESVTLSQPLQKIFVTTDGVSRDLYRVSFISWTAGKYVETPLNVSSPRDNNVLR
jgi:hypothetical protein